MINGKDGKDGIDGKDGRDGKDASSELVRQIVKAELQGRHRPLTNLEIVIIGGALTMAAICGAAVYVLR